MRWYKRIIKRLGNLEDWKHTSQQELYRQHSDVTELLQRIWKLEAHLMVEYVPRKSKRIPAHYVKWQSVKAKGKAKV